MLGVPDWRKPSNFAKRCYGGQGPSDLFRVVSRYDDNLDDFEFDHHHHYCHHTSTIKAKKLRMKDKDGRTVVLLPEHFFAPGLQI